MASAATTATGLGKVNVRRSSRRTVVQLAAGMAVILAAIGFLAYQGLTNSLVFYITPSELLQKGQADVGIQLRLGGEVRPHSYFWNPKSNVLRFALTDSKASIPVVSSSVPPAMLRNGGGAVVQGVYRGGTFTATAIMVKHDADYVAPKSGQLPANDNFAHK